MGRDYFEEYAVIESRIAALEAEKEQLKPHIIEMMIENGRKPEERPFGKFTISKYKTWSYPKWVTKLGDEFKAAQEKAKSTEEATCEEKDSMRYTPVKL